ncbi:MAG: hypothetical protein NTW21_08120 [Verrucomicrobia bacterium]|nr:hypothetical protein [Verrucomicrobiota bacterium]
MDAEEVHPQLRQLTEHGLVVVGAPCVEAERVRAPRVHPAPVEQRLAGVVQPGQFPFHFQQLELGAAVNIHLGRACEVHFNDWFRVPDLVGNPGGAPVPDGCDFSLCWQSGSC